MCSLMSCPLLSFFYSPKQTLDQHPSRHEPWERCVFIYIPKSVVTVASSSPDHDIFGAMHVTSHARKQLRELTMLLGSCSSSSRIRRRKSVVSICELPLSPAGSYCSSFLVADYNLLMEVSQTHGLPYQSRYRAKFRFIFYFWFCVYGLDLDNCQNLSLTRLSSSLPYLIVSH